MCEAVFIAIWLLPQTGLSLEELVLQGSVWWLSTLFSCRLMMVIMLMGLNYVSNCGHQRAYCSSPGDIVYDYGEPRWNDTNRGDFWFVHQSFLEIPQTPSGSKTRVTADGKVEFCLMKYLFHISKGSLTCCKIVLQGADGFTSPPKEGIMRILIALKNPSS
jgi:hypothetical protein